MSGGQVFVNGPAERFLDIYPMSCGRPEDLINRAQWHEEEAAACVALGAYGLAPWHRMTAKNLRTRAEVTP